MKLKFLLRSLGDTEKFGRILGEYSRPGDVILLIGNLGAGKTTLTRFIAGGLGVPPENYITSPSFNLMNRYSGRMPLYHIDCYRLEGEDDVEESGLMDYIVADGLTVVEWPDRLGSLKPDERLDIELAGGRNEERLATVTPCGKDWQERVRTLKKKFLHAAVGSGD
ncbi:MAG: tRNA (adenosine(37)-N6)-threonylcarbamoyltransferase complex ATPase subunit type 1 TsaE [Desulfobulbaceae bacterium]|nr:tRNA (adenosine(37)-N6)-threonylcarbamoyltransferase complex ATPase subunit type 1 TsaE [Desulfobulbaceae bacterium]